ncbi:hypothetical protein ACVWZL_003306 [Bradyrhizobium sp. GM2.4]
MTFNNGNTGRSLNAGNNTGNAGYNTVTTDWVPFTYDAAKKLVVAIHASGAGINFTQQTGLAGATVYTSVARHTSGGNHQADNSGVTAPNLPVSTATTCIVAKVEVQDYTTFSILDSQHLVLILGTGVGEPMTVKSVRVWQASDAGNMRA